MTMTISKTDMLLDEYRSQIVKGIGHLSYSLKKVSQLSADVTTLNNEDLESWEGFAARFGRVSDIFLSKYLRAYVLRGDPAFRGSLRDFVNQGEKLGLIEDAELWMTIRELRNSAANEYIDQELSSDLEKMRELAPHLIQLEKKIEEETSKP